ncbi:hypothetical protein K1T71_002189 [Dendrolimus kikuchii]|uniref:Uncharacterized protein n=1 Tax=Dendrolimus kikuchii TaxID=765133 RepID=A0ACC1DFY5_9NEOP|nr:hypothetical protein K1T71_002189 [Dendrolimus kikuchii]
MKLLKIHLRYHPPGLILEYLQKGAIRSKDIDLLDLNSNSDTKEIAKCLYNKEALITEDVREQIEQCLEILKKRIEHEGPTGKRFYIYKTLMTHLLPLTNVAFDKSGNKCLTGSYDRTCKMWDIESGKELKSLEGHQNVVYSVSFNFPACNRVLTGSFDKSAKIWNPDTGECLATLWGHTGEVVAAQFNAKTDLVGTGSMDNTAKLFDVRTGNEIHTYTGHKAEVIALQFDPNEGQKLITGSFDGTISIWDTRAKERVAVLKGHDGEISNVQFNWDSSLVGSSSLDGSAKLWDARQTSCLATVSGHTDEVLDICFDWAGQRMATSSSDCSARIYDVRSDFKELAVMKGHREEVSKVCFSPAGGSLLTASADRSARVWNTTTGNCIQVPLDHFGFQRNETFQIKYLVNEDNWDRGNGPIFFYTGNEGQIEQFAKHTGFMWEIAAEFKAKLVFAEHRYYGNSKPFGNKSLDNEHIGYLTSAQALADYADLVNFLQDGDLKPRYPVIAFGGSYGGMLAAYFRMKYPHIVAGAIAASAPVHMYPGMVPDDIFNRIVTSSYKVVNMNCSTNIRNSWSIIRNFSSSATGADWLQNNWRLCSKVNSTSVNSLIDFLESMYTTVAMVNYPFPSDFLVPLPAQPIRVACQYLTDKLDGQKLLEAIAKILDMYTNYDKNNKCVDFMNGDNYSNLDASGWDYQACTEMVMPISSTGVTDFFEPSPWNFTSYSEECHKKYNVYPNENMARIQYGGNMLEAASNIVFSNGLMDPWAGGGILNTVSQTIKAVIITEGAHHLDLMPSNPADPESVQIARQGHKDNISGWINQFYYEQPHRRP